MFYSVLKCHTYLIKQDNVKTPSPSKQGHSFWWTASIFYLNLYGHAIPTSLLFVPPCIRLALLTDKHTIISALVFPASSSQCRDHEYWQEIQDWGPAAHFTTSGHIANLIHFPPWTTISQNCQVWWIESEIHFSSCSRNLATLQIEKYPAVVCRADLFLSSIWVISFCGVIGLHSPPLTPSNIVNGQFIKKKYLKKILPSSTLVRGQRRCLFSTAEDRQGPTKSIIPGGS